MMKKKLFSVLAVFLMIVGWCKFAVGGNLMSLPVEMQGRYGATHYIDISAGAAFEGMITSEVYQAKYPIPANTTVRFIGYELRTPFVGSVSGQLFGAATVAFGTEDASTTFMTAKQCGPTNSIWWTSGLPTVTVAVTGTNATFTGTTTWGTLYSAATNLMVTITPPDDESLAWAQRGQLRIFIQKREPYGK
jgi:hypothetical protein